MKVVFIITDLSTGGAEMMLFQLLQHLNPRFLPHVISLTSLGEIGPRIKALGIPVEAMGMRRTFPNPIAIIKLYFRLKELKPDIVHTWMYHADLLGGLTARFAGVSAVGWGIHHSNLDKDKNKRSTLMVIRVCAILSRWIPKLVLCCSKVASQVHSDAGYLPQKMVVIPNGFDISRYKPDKSARMAVREELGLGENVLLVGLIGRYTPLKNHLGFCEAAGELHRQLPNVHFVLAGKGVDESNHELVRSVQEQGIGSVTHLLGLRNDIPRIMSALDVLASSSNGEAFPIVLGEAMACGVPCVVTDVGDSSYIVGNVGRVVLPKDMMGLAQALKALLNMPYEERIKIGIVARSRIEDNFEIGKVTRQYEEFYDSLCVNKNFRNA